MKVKNQGKRTPIILTGQSGCLLEIGTKNDEHVVLKTAPNAMYSERLRRQHDKQKSFFHHALATPKVLATHQDSKGNFGFSMEYINGKTLAEHLLDAHISSVGGIAQHFLHLIPPSLSTPDPDAASIFFGKIKEVEKNLSLSQRNRLDRAIKILKGHSWNFCFKSACHGDLALDNILVKDGKIYLIDFLDSFYESWMMDIAKLLFDIETRWSYRRHASLDQNLTIRLLVFKKILLDAILRLKFGNRMLTSIRYMSLLHLLRVIPYTKDERIIEYLYGQMHNLCDTIEKKY